MLGRNNMYGLLFFIKKESYFKEDGGGGFRGFFVV